MIDLGLRLDDIEDDRRALAAQVEPVDYGKADPRPNLIKRGATTGEIDFLCQTATPPFYGRRVELNALVGRTFIDWLEAKLEAAGVKKIIADADTLERAYRNAYRLELINHAIADAFEEADYEASTMAVPDNLVTWVTDELSTDRRTTWDGAIARRVLDEMEP